MKDFIKALQLCKGYDWICNHGYELKTNELIDIIKETIYAIHTETKDEQNIYDEIADLLQWIYKED